MIECIRGGLLKKILIGFEQIRVAAEESEVFKHPTPISPWSLPGLTTAEQHGCVSLIAWHTLSVGFVVVIRPCLCLFVTATD